MTGRSLTSSRPGSSPSGHAFLDSARKNKVLEVIKQSENKKAHHCSSTSNVPEVF